MLTLVGPVLGSVEVRERVGAASFRRSSSLFPGVSIRSGADEWGSSGSLFQDCFPDPTTVFQLSHRLHCSSRDGVLVTRLMNRICEELHAVLNVVVQEEYFRLTGGLSFTLRSALSF